MTVAEIAECARLADVVDGPLSTAGAEAYSALGAMAKRMARELAVMRAEREARDAAWTRLARADSAVWLANAREEDPRPALEERDAARQALRDLGVDVDALLEER